MPSRHVSTRLKLKPQRVVSGLLEGSASAANVGEEPHHAIQEYMIGVLGICFNLMFAVGSICFFSEVKAVLELGDWLFIIASVGVFLMAGWTALECLVARRASELNELQRDELLESLLYCISALIFAGGSVLFMPGLYASETSEFWGHEWGAWLFAIGSFGFLTAAYWNALGLGARRDHSKKKVKEAALARSRAEESCSYIASFELWVLLTASALFVVGSFLYRPSLETQCPEARRLARAPHAAPGRSMLQSGKFMGQHPTLRVGFQGDAEPAMPMCLSPATQGTYLYTIGSFMFVVQSIMCLTRTWILHSAHQETLARKAKLAV